MSCNVLILSPGVSTIVGMQGSAIAVATGQMPSTYNTIGHGVRGMVVVMVMVIVMMVMVMVIVMVEVL